MTDPSTVELYARLSCEDLDQHMLRETSRPANIKCTPNYAEHVGRFLDIITTNSISQFNELKFFQSQLASVSVMARPA
jgi:hypothetical protein